MRYYFLLFEIPRLVKNTIEFYALLKWKLIKSTALCLHWFSIFASFPSSRTRVRVKFSKLLVGIILHQKNSVSCVTSVQSISSRKRREIGITLGLTSKASFSFPTLVPAQRAVAFQRKRSRNIFKNCSVFLLKFSQHCVSFEYLGKRTSAGNNLNILMHEYLI